MGGCLTSIFDFLCLDSRFVLVLMFTRQARLACSPIGRGMKGGGAAAAVSDGVVADDCSMV